MKPKETNQNKFIKQYKEFEDNIIDKYNPSSKGLSPQIGTVKLFEVYLNQKVISPNTKSLIKIFDKKLTDFQSILIGYDDENLLKEFIDNFGNYIDE